MCGTKRWDFFSFNWNFPSINLAPIFHVCWTHYWLVSIDLVGTKWHLLFFFYWAGSAEYICRRSCKMYYWKREEWLIIIQWLSGGIKPIILTDKVQKPFIKYTTKHHPTNPFTFFLLAIDANKNKSLDYHYVTRQTIHNCHNRVSDILNDLYIFIPSKESKS